MPQNPDWLLSLFAGKRSPSVIRGLNLVLRLADPAKLPLMLWDIAAAQPKIDQAIRELSFLHFARFVPSWDGRALMVVTEFDGPIEDYVLDFVIVIGDVFDRLLSYVESPPRLPVRDHPTEFLRYVRQWNRIPYGPRRLNGSPALLPSQLDYPIYKAYPDKTVLDIHGHPKDTGTWRPPVIDGPADPVELADVQGNILRGYGAVRSLHLFVQVKDAAKARGWLAHKSLTCAESWAPGTKPALATNIGITYEGLQVLLPWRQRDLAKFPTAFREGAQTRAHANGDAGKSDPSQWAFGNDDTPVDLVISLYDLAETASTTFANARGQLERACTRHGLRIVHSQHGGSAKTFQPFGFKDAISEPRIAGLTDASAKADMQPAASAGEFILGQEYTSIYGGTSLRDLPADLAQNGSFGVMRLMELHEDRFKKTVEAAAAGKDALTADDVSAKLMGRYPDGTPLAACPHHVNRASRADGNEFDYAPSWEYPNTADDFDGRHCPLGAHIRRVNPRSARVPGQRHSRRLLRRGVPTTHVDTDGREQPALLGLFFCGNLERQYEFVLRHWIQGSAADRLGDSQDPIAGVRDKPTPFQLDPDDAGRRIHVPPLVTTRGSLYLFYPGLKMFHSLLADQDQAQVHSQPAPRPIRWPAVLKRAEHRLRTAPARARNALILETLGRFMDEKRLGTWRPKLEKWVPQLMPQRFEHDKGEPGRHMQAGRKQHKARLRPSDSAFIAEPFQHSLSRMLPRPLVWVPEHHAYWALSQAAVKHIFNTPTDFVQAPSEARLRGIIRQDGPKHTEVRTTVSAAFKAATAHVPTYVHDAIQEVMPRLRQLTQFDFIREFAAPVPRQVFWRFFGLPADDVMACDAAAQSMMRYYRLPDPQWQGSRTAYADATLRLTAHVTRALVKAWVAELAPWGGNAYQGTLIGEIASRTRIDLSELPTDLPLPPQLLRVHFPRDERPLATLEAVAVLVQVVLAGYMSTQFLLGSAMLNFLRPLISLRGGWPWQLLKEAPDRRAALEGALEEALRFDPPVAIVERYTAREVVFEGVKMPQDCPVYAVIAAANRDGAGLDAFQWVRPQQPNLSLGHGIHECIGRQLQKQIALPAFTALLNEFGDLALCHPNATPAWLDNIYFRGLLTLPVVRQRSRL